MTLQHYIIYRRQYLFLFLRRHLCCFEEGRHLQARPMKSRRRQVLFILLLSWRNSVKESIIIDTPTHTQKAFFLFFVRIKAALFQTAAAAVLNQRNPNIRKTR